MKKVIIMILSAICAAFMIGALVACGDDDDGLTEYTVCVTSLGGDKLRGVTVSLYDDELTRVGVEITDKTGTASFRLEAGEYDVRLTTLPNGYMQPTGSFTTAVNGGEVKIALESKVIEGSAPANYQYSAGDVMYDFEVRTTQNTTFKLSEALKTKKLVLINFWATWCGPCVSEFPYMAEAYEDYKDDVAIIALSSYDNNDAITSFLANNNLTGASFDWASDQTAGVSNHFNTASIPLSVFIDRYGVFCYAHAGAMTSKSDFTRYFSHYCSDDYVQNPDRGEDDDQPTFERPLPTYDPVDSSVIEAAINGEGFTGTYHPEQDTSDAKYSWPWLVGTDDNGDKYIYNSNKGVQQYSFATIYLNYHANVGDVLAFEYNADIEDGYDYLYVIYDNGEVSTLTGFTDGWRDYYLYVAKEEGDYQVCFFYYADEMNESGSQVEDIVKIRNIRLTTVDEITEKGESRDIKYHCATGLNETTQKYDNYVEVGLNTEDGYYHLLDANKEPNGPLVLLNTMTESHWSNDSVYELAYLDYFDFGAKGNYNDIIIDYSGYSAFSDYLYYVPVTEELKQALVKIAENYIPQGYEAHEPYDEEWLEMCVYYEHYGVGEAVKDPIKGVTHFSYYELTEYEGEAYTDENYMEGFIKGEITEVTISKILLPRGLYYKFVPKEDGVYEFRTYGDVGTTCWIHEAEAVIADRYTAPVLNEEQEDDSNFIVYVPMQKDKEYFVMLDLYYQSGSDYGTFYIGIRNVGSEVKKLLNVTSYAYTTSGDMTSGSFVAAQIIMIADQFVTDPISGEPYIFDRNESTDIYVDLFGYNPLTGDVSLAEIIDPTPTPVKKLDDKGNVIYDENNKPVYETDDKGNILYEKVYYKIHVFDNNGNMIPETDASGKPVLDKDGNPVYKSMELKYEGEQLEYLKGLLEESQKVGKDSELYGMVKVDKQLMEFLIEFTHTVSDMRAGNVEEGEDPKFVENEWLMMCYFYRTYKI